MIFEKNTDYTFASGSSFKASQGWKFDEEKNVLTAPEDDVTVYFIEAPFTKSVDEIVEHAWKTINPQFSLKVLQRASLPAREGWQELHQFVYDVSAQENRVVIALIRVFNGTSYVQLLDGSHAGMSRRGAQLGIALESWKPATFKNEDLSKKTPKKFAATEQQQFEEFVRNAMTKLQIPGVAIAVIQDGHVVFRKGFGVKEVGKNEAVTPDTPFMIGSVTKPLTTLMIAKMVELGKISWDTPVTQALPDFQLTDKELTKKLLVKHTASASTGMPRRDLEFFFSKKGLTGEEAMAQMARMSPTTGFGETFQYSNHLVATGGFAAATVYVNHGTLLEKYATAMNDLVFRPLDMRHTFVCPTPEFRTLSVASPHAMNFNYKMASIPQEIDNMVYCVAPAGSVWSTIDDLAKYVMMELNKGRDSLGNVLFDEKQILKRREPGIKASEEMSYGLGLCVSKYKNLPVIGHDGNTIGCSAAMSFMPEHNIGMVILVNAQQANGFMKIIEHRFLELTFEAENISEKHLDFIVNQTEQSLTKYHERVFVEPQKTAWINTFVDDYYNPDLGHVSIKKDGDSFVLVTDRWTSKLGSYEEESGNKFLVPVSAGFIAVGLVLKVQTDPVKKLILDAGQQSYEFVCSNV